MPLVVAVLMYSHLTVDGRELRYIYAPPYSSFEKFDPFELPNPPYPGARRRERTVYFCWWAYLREHPGYWACCERGGTGEFAALYADFGDIREPDFLRWWRRGGALLFCEPQDDGVVFHDTLPTDLDPENAALVSIPLSGDLETIMDAVSRRIKPRLAEYRKRHDTVSRARYPVHTKPVLTSLYQALMIHHARKRAPDVHLYELPELADLPVYDMDKPQRTALASRCLAQARALIRNVVLGKFPCVDADPDAAPPVPRARGPRKGTKPAS